MSNYFKTEETFIDTVTAILNGAFKKKIIIKKKGSTVKVEDLQKLLIKNSLKDTTETIKKLKLKGLKDKKEKKKFLKNFFISSEIISYIENIVTKEKIKDVLSKVDGITFENEIIFGISLEDNNE